MCRGPGVQKHLQFLEQVGAGREATRQQPHELPAHLFTCSVVPGIQSTINLAHLNGNKFDQ